MSPFDYKTILHLNTKVFFQVHPALHAFFTARFAQDAKFAKKRYISPPASLKTQSSQRKDIFFLLLFSFLSKENKKEVNLAFLASLR
jgi:hypothetical protein